MCSINILLLLFLSSLRYSNASNDWDYIIFTQSWPTTVCRLLKDLNFTSTCAFPQNPDAWSIHGIWPTLVGSTGPEFCNQTWVFDNQEVKTLAPALKRRWTNVLKDAPINNLWAHEWDKHGTCGASIESLNTQTKYFAKGLEWLKKYTMTKILLHANITPSDTITYTLNEIHLAIKGKTEINPEIRCENINGLQYLMEIRICFSKYLELINCKPKKYSRYFDNVDLISNCNSTDIIYGKHEGT